jgi:hypothetical protein
MNGDKIIPTNKLSEFAKYDFSGLWLKTENRFVYGIIGDDNQRILIKILRIEKDHKNPEVYLISGKSSVKRNICDFTGKITIISIQESIRSSYGVDNEFKGQSKIQGVLTAEYVFSENKDQKHVGVFEGELKTKWCLDKEYQIKYDNINAHSDGYFNNAFVGTWKMYNSNLKKKCNWGDYRVPNVDCSFDIGVGEFNVSEKYWNKGWLDIALNNKSPNGAIIAEKTGKAEVEWWE